MENPFADYGKIIKGERFVGRKNEIAAIQNRIFGFSYGNLAIQGLPRIGKSSLAWNAIIEKKEELEKRNIIPVEINAGKVSSSADFFVKMISDLHKLVKKIKDIDIEYFNNLNVQIGNLKKNFDRNDLVEEYLMLLRENDIRVIYILDEFDAVRLYFSLTDFQFLRELSYNPKTEICLVTLSDRTLKEIEPQKGTCSVFYQTFTDINLSMCNEEEMKV